MKTRSLMKSRFGLACFVAASLLVGQTEFAVAQGTEIAEAKHLVEIDQSKKALDVLTKAASTYPTSPAVFYNLGLLQLKMNKRQEALQAFDKGIAADPKDALNIAGKGHLSMLEANAAKAKLDFDKALSMTKSKNVEVMQAVARGYMVDPKRATETVTLLTTAKGKDDHNPETFILLGDAYLQLNDGGKAVSAYETAAALDQKNALAHYKVGRVYLRSRNYDAAQESFSKAISIDPNYALAYKEQGELYYQMSKGTDAVKAYEKFISLTESPEKYQSKLAFYYLMAKDFKKANDIFKQLVSKDSTNATILKYYGVSQYESKDSVGARSTFEQYLAKQKPEAIEAADYNYYGKVLLKLKQDSLAMQAFEKSVTMEDKQPNIHETMAQTYFANKKYAESVASYRKLFQYRKPSSQDLFNLGRAQYYAEDYVKADSTFAALGVLQPNMTVVDMWAARSKASQDSTSENGLAKPYYEKLVQKVSTAASKSKNDNAMLTEAYLYLGYYSYLKGQNSAAKDFYQKVLAIDPKNEKATVAIKALTAPPPKPKGSTGK
ncbi:tetratricopeptide repeat protein [Chryseolinea sp. T2]|uniref:tetratricopeptide repeat protein n=1 Tax=Chryseolinea sp. T2 TaxID=3129255 RepID=UPI003077B1AA